MKIRFKIFIWIFIIGIFGTVLSLSLGIWGDAASTVKKEYSASAMLKKYEWFKDASATLESKLQTIKVYDQNMIDMHNDYIDIYRKDWDRLDKAQYNQWKVELAGLKASYNQLASEYNSQSNKFNWSPFNSDTEVPPNEIKQLLVK